MVRRRLFTLFLLPLLWATAISAAASASLTVEPDRARLYQDEVLTLTVKGTTDIDLNLSNLFDFDTADLPKPDIEQVEDDFEILRRNQQYSIRTVNNQMIGEITWTYQLAPRQTGELIIPALTFQDAVSQPITINVVDGNPPQQSTSVRESFIELSTDKDSVYVQEQLVLSVKLFFNGNMVRGELSEPSHPNAIIESLGKQTEYTRFRDGVRYRVVERRYALFPQKPGELALPPIRFEGQARDTSGRLKFLRDSKQLFTVPIKDVPAEFTGQTWLPASDLTLSESGLPNNPTIEPGQNLSRSLSLVAEGLPAEALPPFGDDTPAGLRAYPDNPVRATVPSDAGLTAKLSQTSALVPVRSGALTLPEIRVPWWDTDTNTQKLAVIPARTLVVTGAPAQTVSDGSTPGTLPASEPQTTPGNDSVTALSTPPATDGFWRAAALIMLAGWAITGLGWWYSRRYRPRPLTNINSVDGSEKALFSALCESAQAGDPDTPDLLIRWVNHLHPERSIKNLGDAFRLMENGRVEREIRQLQAITYSLDAKKAGQWQGKELVDALSGYRNQRRQKMTDASGNSPLPPLYPEELGAR